MRREIADTVSGGLDAPKTMARRTTATRMNSAPSTMSCSTARKAGEIPAPTPEELAKYLRRAQERIPRAGVSHRRHARRLRRRDVAQPDNVTDADARSAYDERNARASARPSGAHVAQIVFPTAEEAQAAAERLEEAELTFEALAKERGLSEKDIDLGLVTKAGMIDRAVADAAFALKEGETSAPIKGMFGTMLVHVVKIEPENVKPFEEVAAEIKQALATERARSEIAALHDKVEDERAGGSRLTEIAQKLNLNARTIEAIDRQGRDPTASRSPTSRRRISFRRLQLGGRRRERTAPDGGRRLSLVRGAGVKPSRERTLDEVRGAGRAALARGSGLRTAEGQGGRDCRQGESRRFARRCRGGGGPQRPNHVRPQALRQRRLDAAAVVDAVFATPKDGVGSAEGKDGNERIIFQVTDISVPAFDANSPDSRKISDTMRRSITEDLLAQYVTRLQTDLGATINMDAVRRIVGGSSADQNCMQIEPAPEAFAAALCARRAAGGLDHARRRSRNAGLGISEGRRRTRQ